MLNPNKLHVILLVARFEYHFNWLLIYFQVCVQLILFAILLVDTHWFHVYSLVWTCGLHENCVSIALQVQYFAERRIFKGATNAIFVVNTSDLTIVWVFLLLLLCYLICLYDIFVWYEAWIYVYHSSRVHHVDLHSGKTEIHVTLMLILHVQSVFIV